MRINELHNQPVQADTYEASMALNQLLKIGKHAIKIHNMIDDSAEMEAWVAKKIDLAGDYVKKVHGYMQGENAGLYDDDGMTEDNKQQASDKEIKMAKGVAFDKRYKDGNYSGAYNTINKIKPGLSDHPDVADALRRANEDAGEGHMSKSTLYHTAKYAIELMDMIKKGDDLEGWVQSKLNKAADYLQGVHNYEEYQKLNPYREELDSDLLQRHAGIIQKNIDEILARETSLDDVDTKPGMMRILAKRVNEVEKEIAKENRKNTDEAHGGQHSTSGRSMTKGEMNKREKIVKGMKKNKAGFKKRYGKDAEAVMYATATKNAMKDDEQMQEGIKEWGKRLAMAGVIVAGLAGVGSIQDAIDRSVPAVAAIEKALEMAQDQGNDELAKMIEKDLSAVKVRLSSGQDLGFVKGMQDKYSKFIQTEGLAYESQLALALNQRLK